MEIYKGMRLRQVLENNGVDVEVLSEYNAYFCVPTTKTAYAIIERWCEENNIHIAEVISAVKIMHNGNEDMFYLCNDIRLDKKTPLPVPTRSPWGHVKTVHTLCKGVYEVDTAIHGGIMIAEKMKDNYLAKYAQGMAVTWGSFLCYEKDSMASIALCELLDRKLIKCTPGFCGTPENFEKYIDEKIQQEHPEYAIFRANMMAYGKYVFKPGDICKYENVHDGDFCAIVEIVSICDFSHGIVDVQIRDIIRDNKAKSLETFMNENRTVKVGMRKLSPYTFVPKKSNNEADNNAVEVTELLKYLKEKRTADTTNLTLVEFVEKLLEKNYDDGREDEAAYTCTELCPHCKNEITLFWNPDVDGYKAYCPVCGKRLMMCDACMHDGGFDCDYCSATDSCRHNPPRKRKVTKK